MCSWECFFSMTSSHSGSEAAKIHTLGELPTVRPIATPRKRRVYGAGEGRIGKKLRLQESESTSGIILDRGLSHKVEDPEQMQGPRVIVRVQLRNCCKKILSY